MTYLRGQMKTYKEISSNPPSFHLMCSKICCFCELSQHSPENSPALCTLSRSSKLIVLLPHNHPTTYSGSSRSSKHFQGLLSLSCHSSHSPTYPHLLRSCSPRNIAFTTQYSPFTIHHSPFIHSPWDSWAVPCCPISLSHIPFQQLLALCSLRTRWCLSHLHQLKYCLRLPGPISRAIFSKCFLIPFPLVWVPSLPSTICSWFRGRSHSASAPSSCLTTCWLGLIESCIVPVL